MASSDNRRPLRTTRRRPPPSISVETRPLYQTHSLLLPVSLVHPLPNLQSHLPHFLPQQDRLPCLISAKPSPQHHLLPLQRPLHSSLPQLQSLPPLPIFSEVQPLNPLPRHRPQLHHSSLSPPQALEPIMPASLHFPFHQHQLSLNPPLRLPRAPNPLKPSPRA